MLILHWIILTRLPAIAEWGQGCYHVRSGEKTKTNCKAGGQNLNHSETLVRDNRKRFKVKTALRPGKKAIS